MVGLLPTGLAAHLFVNEAGLKSQECRYAYLSLKCLLPRLCEDRPSYLRFGDLFFGSGVRVGGGGAIFSYTKSGQILNIVIVVRLEIENLEESDFLSIKIVKFEYEESDFLAVKYDFVKSLTCKR